MRALAFHRSGGRVREACFRERSSLPIGAACLVANGIREVIAGIMSAPVSARLLEPVIPAPAAWSAIARDAVMYRMRGTVTDAAIVLRPRDAAAIAVAAFGERVASLGLQRPLSPIERDVLDRTAATLAGSLTALCGTRESFESVGSIVGFETFFEILLERPIEARIGIAIARDPLPEAHGLLDIADIGEVALFPALHLDLAAVEAATLGRLEVGAFLPFGPSGSSARLALDGCTLARGVCGVANGRYCLAVQGAG